MAQLGATRCHMGIAYQAGGGSLDQNVVSNHEIPAAFTGIQVLMLNENVGAAAGTSVSFRVGCRLRPGGAMNQFLFSGVAEGTLGTGPAYVLSDMLNISGAAGWWQFSVFSRIAAGTDLPWNMPLSKLFEDRYESGAALTDKSMTPDTVPAVGNAEFPKGFSIAAIILTFDTGERLVVHVSGDSQLQGQGTGIYQGGYPVMALRANKIPYAQLSQGGSNIIKLREFVQSAIGIYFIDNFMPNGSAWLIQYGVNAMWPLGAGGTAAAADTYITDEVDPTITAIKARNATHTVWPGTVVPVPDCPVNDYRESVQTVAAWDPMRVRYNDRVRTGLTNTAGHMDPAGLGRWSAKEGVESALNSGKQREDFARQINDPLHWHEGYHLFASGNVPIEAMLGQAAHIAGPIASAAQIEPGGRYMDILAGEHVGTALTPAELITGLYYTRNGVTEQFSAVELLGTRKVRAYFHETVLQAQAILLYMDAVEANVNLADARGNKADLIRQYPDTTRVLALNNANIGAIPYGSQVTTLGLVDPPMTTVFEATFTFADGTLIEGTAPDIGGGTLVDRWGNSHDVLSGKLRLRQPGAGVWNLYATSPEVGYGITEFTFQRSERTIPDTPLAVAMRYDPVTGKSIAARYVRVGGEDKIGIQVNGIDLGVEATLASLIADTEAVRPQLHVKEGAGANPLRPILQARLVRNSDNVVLAQTVEHQTTADVTPITGGTLGIYQGDGSGDTLLDHWRAQTVGGDTISPNQTGAIATSPDGHAAILETDENVSVPMLPAVLAAASKLAHSAGRAITHIAAAGSKAWRLRFGTPFYQGEAAGTLAYNPASAGTALTDGAGNEMAAFSGIALVNNSLTADPGAATVTGVTVTPDAPPAVTPPATIQFAATVQGTNSPSQTVTWSTNLGSIDASGLWTAPAATSSLQAGTVTATSVADPAFSDTVNVTVSATGGGTLPVGQRDVIWTFDPLESTEMESLSTEFVKVPVRALLDFVAIDPSALSCWIAFKAAVAAVEPLEADWLSAQWLYSAGRWHLVRLVGPRSPSTTALAAGAYAVWIRIQDNPEHLVRKVGTVTIS